MILKIFRKVLESRQPVDVQTLQAQKRELQMQLEREENEKHELFLQVVTIYSNPCKKLTFRLTNS